MSLRSHCRGVRCSPRSPSRNPRELSRRRCAALARRRARTASARSTASSAPSDRNGGLSGYLAGGITLQPGAPRRRRAGGLVRHHRRGPPAADALRRVAVLDADAGRVVVPQGRRRPAQLSRGHDRDEDDDPLGASAGGAAARRRLRLPRGLEALGHALRQPDRLHQRQPDQRQHHRHRRELLA